MLNKRQVNVVIARLHTAEFHRTIGIFRTHPIIGGFRLNPPHILQLDVRRIADNHIKPTRREHLRKCLAVTERINPLKLFIAATAVRTGKVRLFHTGELSEAALLASACLPTLHHAVEIDGEHYWDGGFTANPAIYPLLYECHSSDILLVLLNPLRREAAPRSADDIAARSMELGFSTTFLREMRMVAHARRFIADGGPAWLRGRFERKLMDERFHLIDAVELGDAGKASKLNAASGFLMQLRDLGRARAEAWLQAHGADIGRRETAAVDALFL